MNAVIIVISFHKPNLIQLNERFNIFITRSCLAEFIT